MACPSVLEASFIAFRHHDGASRVRGRLEGLGAEIESLVVYGGDETQQRAVASLVPWSRFHGH